MNEKLIIDRDRLLKAKLIHRYPAADKKSGVPFPDGVDMFSFPHGAQLMTKRPDPTTHSFVLTNLQGRISCMRSSIPLVHVWFDLLR